MRGRTMCGDRVYVAKCTETGYFKIGVSSMPRARVRELSGATKTQVALVFSFPGSFPEERLLKGVLHNCSIEYPFKANARKKACGGSEWFDLSASESGRIVEMLEDASMAGEVEKL